MSAAQRTSRSACLIAGASVSSRRKSDDKSRTRFTITFYTRKVNIPVNKVNKRVKISDIDRIFPGLNP